MLEWSQTDLGQRSGLSQTAITNLESGRYRPTLKTLEMIVSAFRRAGVEITDEGVRFHSPTVQIIKDPDFEIQSHEFVYNACVNEGIREILFFYPNPTLMSPDHYKRTQKHIQAMDKLGVSRRVIVSDRRTANELPGNVVCYRSVPDAYVMDTSPFYVLGPYTGSFLYDLRQVVIIRHQSLADTHRRTFAFLWDHGKEVSAL